MGRPKLAIQVPCTHCQILVWRQPCKLKRAKEIFCSKQCRGAHRRYSFAETERFWAQVDRAGGPDACWPWTGSCTKAGYGQISFGQNGHLYTHRLAYELIHGMLLPGFLVLHRCDNPPCCNPFQCLFSGTPQDNMHDASLKGRIAYGMRHGNAFLPTSAVEEIIACYKIVPAADLAKKSHISRHYVYDIQHKRARKHEQDMSR